MRTCRASSGLGLLLAGLIGCSGPRADLAPVKGVLTCDGKPVAKATVRFAPATPTEFKDPKEGSGTTGADGVFVLTTEKNGDGALVGKHKVIVSFEDIYKVACKSPEKLLMEVKPGQNDFKIELKSK